MPRVHSIGERERGVTVPTGGHEPEKHGEDIANAAKAEMNEGGEVGWWETGEFDGEEERERRR